MLARGMFSGMLRRAGGSWPISAERVLRVAGEIPSQPIRATLRRRNKGRKASTLRCRVRIDRFHSRDSLEIDRLLFTTYLWDLIFVGLNFAEHLLELGDLVVLEQLRHRHL